MSKKRIMNEVNKCYNHRVDLQVPYSFVLVDTNVSVILYNKLFLQLLLTERYPFHPPEVLINDSQLINYLKWCVNSSETINRRKFLSQQAIVNAHYFSLNNITNILVPTLPMDCICCNSILCTNKWTPAFLFINIIDEALYNKKFLFYTSKVGQKLIHLLFNNKDNRWSLSDDLILHIFSFMN